MRIPLFQVDAFADRLFTGNPAAVCPLEAWLPDATMQSLAMENNLAETAFFVPEEGGYRLRWFTPATEVDLCGHATIASAYVVMNCLGKKCDAVSFQTRSGELRVRREAEFYELDFPSRPPQRCGVHPRLVEALGTVPVEILAARDYMVVYQTEEQVRTLQPNMDLLARMDRFAVCVTARGDRYDFVSRFFAPAHGVPEDPVTGSAHSTLIPYWSRRLGKAEMLAFQASPRGGELRCRMDGDRVRIAGKAVLYMEGVVNLSENAGNVRAAGDL
jgi:predicted PhzF superfamily epimerase YddE/YHI9